MRILCLLSFILLLLLLFELKKFNKPILFFNNLFYTLTIFMCYKSCISFLIDSFYIKINYISYTILNLISIGLLIYYIFIKKTKQKLEIKKNNLIIFFSILLMTILIMFLSFGFKLNISFHISDAAAHFMSSKLFSLNNTLEAVSNIKNLTSYGKGFQFFFYTNLGIIYKLFPNITISVQYYLFVLYNFYIYFLITYGFYILLKDKTNNKFSNIMRIIITLLYGFGFPFITTICGFSYWNTGILLCEMFLILLKKYNDLNKNISNYIIGIVMFSIFCSYYLFVPITYFYYFIFMIKHQGNIKKILSKKNIYSIIISLIIPFMLGFCYFILPGLLESFNNYINGISTDGSIYNEIISSVILFIPICIYYIFKNNNKDIVCDISLYQFCYFMILFILTCIKKVSPYYLTKVVYLNYMIIYYLLYKGILILYKKNKTYIIIKIITYFTFMLISFIEIDNYLEYISEDYTNTTILNRLYKINNITFNMIKYPSIIYDNSDIKLLEKINNKKYFNNNLEIQYNGDYIDKRWFEALLFKFPIENYEGNYVNYTAKIDYDSLKREHGKYFLLKKSGQRDSDFENKYTKTIYESNNLKLLKIK